LVEAEDDMIVSEIGAEDVADCEIGCDSETCDEESIGYEYERKVKEGIRDFMEVGLTKLLPRGMGV
jgi:hypothetical protein